VTGEAEAETGVGGLVGLARGTRCRFVASCCDVCSRHLEDHRFKSPAFLRDPRLQPHRTARAPGNRGLDSNGLIQSIGVAAMILFVTAETSAVLITYWAHKC
jgi:hypothetical protein